MKTKTTMKTRNTATPLLATVAGLLALGYFSLLSVVQAVTPPPDGGYNYGNTAEGDSALFNVTPFPHPLTLATSIQQSVTFR